MDENVYCREEYERFFDCLDAADCIMNAVTLPPVGWGGES